MGGRRGRPPLAPLFRGNIRLTGRVSGWVCAHRQVGFRGRTDASSAGMWAIAARVSPSSRTITLTPCVALPCTETLAVFIRSINPGGRNQGDFIRFLQDQRFGHLAYAGQRRGVQGGHAAVARDLGMYSSSGVRLPKPFSVRTSR